MAIVHTPRNSKDTERHRLDLTSLPSIEQYRGYSHDLCIFDLVAARADAAPQAIAIITEDRILTYRDLEIQSNQMARHLRSLGVGAEVTVGLCLQRSASLIIAALGILKAGGAYILMDPTYPVERLSFMLRDAKAAVLVTGTHAPTLPPDHWQVVTMDGDWEDISLQSTMPLASGATVNNLAYVVYTSGSTGQPKGVQITHANLLNLVYWHRSAFDLTAADRATQVAGPGFDATVWEIWPTLAMGAAVLLPDDQTRVSPALLRDWLVAHQITIAFLPTVLAEAVITLEWPKETALRILLTGAETLRRYPPTGLPFKLVNNYGPSENTVVTTSGWIMPDEHAERRPSIGRPISNVEVYVLDDRMRQVPTGMPGELCIGGASLGRGYLNRPELNAEKFVPNPFSSTPGARLYRTGDQVRLLSDGQIDFLGRLDGQIKIRGYRIETDEIAAVLNKHTAIQSSIVTAHADQPGEERLIAYIVQNHQPAPTHSDLRTFLAKWLPDYMIPAVFVLLDTIPLTSNGKLDIAALPAPSNLNILQDLQYVAPRTEIEERLTSILADVLQVNRLSVHDNFFMLGGHSLLGTHVITRIADAFGVELSLYSLFSAPTAAELAVDVENRILARLEALSEDEALRMLAL